MPILFIVEILIQVYFAVHAVKTGRAHYWLWIIIVFPGIGSLIYFLSEYLPDLQNNYKVQKFQSGIAKSLNPSKRLRLLENEVELTPSIKNKKNLADEYVHTGRFDDAIPIYLECLQGMHKNDTAIIEGLCCAYYFKRDFDRARKYLDQLIALRKDKRGDEFDLMYAKILEESGEIEKALLSYAEIVNLFSGEEARCRYALLLERVGKKEEADRLFGEILKNARLSPKFYAKAQKEWINIAKNHKIGPKST